MPESLKQHTGVAAVLMRDNIDTDQIIPSREMKTVSRSGLGEGLFAGWRYTDPGTRTPNPDFVLNRAALKTASILISGENFGCGSSREHAVWALQEFGFRVIIAKSFGEIFHGNCIRNGVLPITLDVAQVSKLSDRSASAKLTIDLEQQVIPTLVVSHVSVLQMLIAYFRKSPVEEAMQIEVPMHTVLKFTPARGGGWNESHHELAPVYHRASSFVHQVAIEGMEEVTKQNEMISMSPSPIWGDHMTSPTSREMLMIDEIKQKTLQTPPLQQQD